MASSSAATPTGDQTVQSGGQKHCRKCDLMDSADNLVGCDSCSTWMHYGCAGVTSSIADPDRTWKCERCRLVEGDEFSQSGISVASSQCSRGSSKLKLELLLIEKKQALYTQQRAEEEALRRKKAEQLAQEEAYMKKKAKEDNDLLQQMHDLLLKEAASEDAGSRKSRLSSRTKRSKVQDWLDKGLVSESQKVDQIPATPINNIVQQPANPTAASVNVLPVLPQCSAGIPTVVHSTPNASSTPHGDERPPVMSTEEKQQRTNPPNPFNPNPPNPVYHQHSNFPNPNNLHSQQNGSTMLYHQYPLNLQFQQNSQHLPSLPNSQNLPNLQSQQNVHYPVDQRNNSDPPMIVSSSQLYVPPSTVYFMVPSSSSTVAPVYSSTSAYPPLSTFCGGTANVAPAPNVTDNNLGVGNLQIPPGSQPSFYQPNVGMGTQNQVSGQNYNYNYPMQSQMAPTVPVQHYGPSSVQVAARQVMPRELPTFSGDPEDWPLFFSSFRNTTDACGYTDAENLARLQRCLKGHALESVKSRLLMPQSVPHVMETLRKLYGRPEILIHSLLHKLREVQSPKAENLPSIITFGLAVQNTVDHMSIANMQDHLCNPMLLHELVGKLPAQLKMDWSRFKNRCLNVNLATFSAFMSELVTTASDVILPGDTTSMNSRSKPKLFVHTEEVKSPAASTKEEASTSDETVKKTCTYCSNASHEIVNCAQFKTLDLDGRWKAIRQKGLCRGCLTPHRKWPCRSGKECGENGCRFRHHALLHSGAVSGANRNESTTSFRSTAVVSNVAHQNHHSSWPYSLFRYLPVTIKGNGKQVETFAFLDDGSSSTLLEAGVATELGISGPIDPLWLSWTGDVTREEKDSQRVTVTISGCGVKERFKINNVRTVQELKLPSQTLPYDDLQKKYPHLEGLPIRSYEDVVPSIIIGIEHARLLTSLRVREGRGNDPIAAKTRLGWCVFGRQSGTECTVEQLHLHTEEDISNRELHEMMKRFFVAEEATVTKRAEAECDKQARGILERTTRRIDGRFETGLLWKQDPPSFPDSYHMAVRRMKSLEKRLAKDPQLEEKVKEQIAAYETKGYAHRITQAEMESTDREHVWYLPLGVVRNPKKPNKIRLIWDAAARVQGVSFNDMLLKGPDMLTSLPAILLRFRQRDIAVCGDIREMFHQIRIRAEDKQSQRFLWRDHPDQTPQIFVMDVATFGATCSPSSAQYVKNTNAQQFASEFPRAVEAIVNGHYVDDYLDSVDTVEEAVSLVSEVRYVHSQAGFDIRSFSSNSAEVLFRLGESECPQSKPMNLEQSGEVERVLGMVWKPAADIFSYDTIPKAEIRELLENRSVPTKRQVLRTVMSLFDPLGLVAFFVVHGKILMQDIWRSGTDWDEEIAEDLRPRWWIWSRLLSQLDKVQIPRCFFSGTNSTALEDLQIHVFVDASETAYSCVAYLRFVENGIPRCALVAAKTKVAPLKPLSVPRLELQAAVIGSRMLNDICTSLDLPIKQRYLWSDSKVFLAWLRTIDSRRYHQYVMFRIEEVRSTTSISEWRYVPSKQNVADEATKWGSGPSFDPSSRWFTGPEFLHQSEEHWPVETQKLNGTEEELRSAFLHHQILPSPLVAVDRFSKWNRLQRATAYVFRAVSRFRQRDVSGPLTGEELLQAENWLWRQAQSEAYPEEYATLSKNKLHPNKPNQIQKSSPLYQQSPYLDNAGVIRMDGRIGDAPGTPFDTKYPILLPKSHRVTYLFVDNYHRRYGHANNETVFNEMKQRIRVSSLRTFIKTVAKECQHCRIYKAVPQPPMMAPLPKVRLTPFIRPFTHTGIDYFGPILVKQGRSQVKRWVALFTCLTVRAVHIEIVHSLSTPSCVMAIRRFVARRGAPSTFYSDNGTNFVGASNILLDQLRRINEECAVTFTNARTSWRFNPPSAPHMGGSWERMVRSVKTAMAAIAEHPRHPDDEVLETVALEAEGIVNSRPLTYIPLESSDQEALTPNHFLLYGTQGVNQPATPETVEGSALRDSWRLTQYLVDQFWKRWVHEYLPTLTRRTKWFEPTKPLEPGDIVFVIEESQRNGWIRGRIMVKGKDGQVRKARVHTANGQLTRPAVKLALLDVGECLKKSLVENPGSSELHGRGDVDDTAGQVLATMA